MEHEIQVKTILDKRTYLHLLEELAIRFGAPVMAGRIHQTRYRSAPWQKGDVRLRRLYASLEGEDYQGQVIIKEDKPGEGVAASQRKQRQSIVTIKCLSQIAKDLDEQDIYRDPSWKKVKHDFNVERSGSLYRVSIQYCSGVITDQGYVAEGTIKLSQPDQKQFHKQNLIDIFQSIGLEPTPDKDFLEMVTGFVNDNSRYARGKPMPYEEFNDVVKAIFSKYETLSQLR